MVTLNGFRKCHITRHLFCVTQTIQKQFNVMCGDARVKAAFRPDSELQLAPLVRGSVGLVSRLLDRGAPVWMGAWRN